MYPFTRKQLDDKAPLYAVRDFDAYKVGDSFDASSVRRDMLSTLWSQHYIDHECVAPPADLPPPPVEAPNVQPVQVRRDKAPPKGKLP